MHRSKVRSLVSGCAVAALALALLPGASKCALSPNPCLTPVPPVDTEPSIAQPTLLAASQGEFREKVVLRLARGRIEVDDVVQPGWTTAVSYRYDIHSARTPDAPFLLVGWHTIPGAEHDATTETLALPVVDSERFFLGPGDHSFRVGLGCRIERDNGSCAAPLVEVEPVVGSATVVGSVAVGSVDLSSGPAWLADSIEHTREGHWYRWETQPAQRYRLTASGDGSDYAVQLYTAEVLGYNGANRDTLLDPVFDLGYGLVSSDPVSGEFSAPDAGPYYLRVVVRTSIYEPLTYVVKIERL